MSLAKLPTNKEYYESLPDDSSGVSVMSGRWMKLSKCCNQKWMPCECCSPPKFTCLRCGRDCDLVEQAAPTEDPFDDAKAQWEWEDELAAKYQTAPAGNPHGEKVTSTEQPALPRVSIVMLTCLMGAVCFFSGCAILDNYWYPNGKPTSAIPAAPDQIARVP